MLGNSPLVETEPFGASAAEEHEVPCLYLSCEKADWLQGSRVVSKQADALGLVTPSHLVVLYTVLDIDEPDNLQLLG